MKKDGARADFILYICVCVKKTSLDYFYQMSHLGIVFQNGIFKGRRVCVGNQQLECLNELFWQFV